MKYKVRSNTLLETKHLQIAGSDDYPFPFGEGFLEGCYVFLCGECMWFFDWYFPS